MKIAVILSGRITGWQECRSTLKDKFMSLYDTDVFISLDAHGINQDVYEFKKEFNVVAEYYESYNKTLKEPPQFRSEETSERKTLSMFYHNFMGMNLVIDHMKKNPGLKYDVVVKFRADVSSEDVFIIPHHIMTNTLYFPNGSNYRGINDQIAFGNMFSMTLYCSLYNHIPKYLYVEKAIFNPEFLLMFHTNFNNMNIMRFPYKYMLHPARFGKALSTPVEEYQPLISRVPLESVEEVLEESSV